MSGSPPDAEAIEELAAEIEMVRAEVAALRTLESDFEIAGHVVTEEVTSGDGHRRIVVRIEAQDSVWRAEQSERRIGEAGWWIRTTFWKIDGGDATR